MVLNPNFFLPGANLSLKIQARMGDKVRIKNLKSLFEFFEKFGRVAHKYVHTVKKRTRCCIYMLKKDRKNYYTSGNANARGRKKETKCY